MKYKQIVLVGGAVRDELLGRPIHDRDYVVVGSTPEDMLEYGFISVGKEFPVFLHPDTNEEYALARTEVSTGKGYQDFKFDFNPDITLKQDVERRDFTINSICKHLKTDEIIDYFNGREDIKNKIIRHINPIHFKTDPLRILRGCRFSSQLDFTIHESTIELFKQMVEDSMLEHLTPERVWKEIEKALHTPYFYLFLEYLDKCNGLKIILPEVYSLKEVPERLDYHPEGNAYKHLILTLKNVHNCFDEYGILYTSKEDLHDMALVNFGLLCHDLGKNLTQECWPSHHGHELLGIDIINKLCDRLKIPNEYKDFGVLCCKQHMRFYKFLDMNVKNQYDMLKEISDFRRWKPISLLFKVHQCDLCGREGRIDEKRINTYWKVLERIKKIYNIMYNITLKDLPKDTQENLFKFKGEQFGKLYRDAMISYLKHGLRDGRITER